MTVTGCATSEVSAAPRFYCVIEGSDVLSPAMTPTEICARLKAPLDSALGVSLQTSDGGGSNDARSSWIKAEARFARNGVASVTLTQSSQGKISRYPGVNYAVSDRGLDEGDVVKLAAEAARVINRS